MAVDSTGDMVVEGTFRSQIDLGHGVVSGTSYDSDSFVVKYSGADLSWKWQALILGNGSAPASSLAIDGQNNVIITGSFYGSEHFGAQTLTNQSPQDGFVAKYSSAGAFNWAQQIASTLYTGYAVGQSVAVGSSGQPVVTGCFKGTATIGNQSLTSAG